jgi:hypothetical protein
MIVYRMEIFVRRAVPSGSASHFLCAATKKGRLTASKRLWQQLQKCVRLGIPQFRQPVWVMSPR